MEIKNYIKRVATYLIKGVPQNITNVEVKVSNPNRCLKDRNIIITGGSRGLGFYIAQKSIQEGAKVLLTGRNEVTLKNAVNILGDAAKYIVFDASDINGIDVFIDKAVDIFHGEKIDSLVSNAGVSYHEGCFRNVTDHGWDAQMNTNLKGNFFLVKKFVEYLETFENKRGNIIVITSERAKRSDDIPYGLSKVATSSFIQAIAQQVIEEGIRINGVGPGVTASDMTGFKKGENMYAEWQSGKRIFMPEEVAEVVNFLLSDFSDCISGEIITCDQGRYISRW